MNVLYSLWEVRAMKIKPTGQGFCTSSAGMMESCYIGGEFSSSCLSKYASFSHLWASTYLNIFWNINTKEVKSHWCFPWDNYICSLLGFLTDFTPAKCPSSSLHKMAFPSDMSTSPLILVPSVNLAKMLSIQSSGPYMKTLKSTGTSTNTWKEPICYKLPVWVKTIEHYFLSVACYTISYSFWRPFIQSLSC